MLLKSESILTIFQSASVRLVPDQVAKLFCVGIFSAQCRFKDAAYLVTTGEGKFFSTGVDVDLVRSPDPIQFIEVLSELQKLLARLLTFPLVTVAAINGKSVQSIFSSPKN